MLRNLFSLLLLMFPCVFIAQVSDMQEKSTNSSSQFRTDLQGNWHLSTTEIVDGYNRNRSTDNFFSSHTYDRTISFQNDSIRVFPDTSLRFYTGGIRNYHYTIEYDSISRAHFIRLLSGKKRKQEELAAYELIKCTKDELILKSYTYLNHELDLARFSIYYTYRRKSVDSLLELIHGSWFHCSQDFRSIGFNTEDTSAIRFLHRSFDSTCADSDNHLELRFHRRHYDHVCSVTSYNTTTGSGYELSFMLDPPNRLLYLGKEEPVVYDILHLDRNELVISLNREKTGLPEKSTGDAWDEK